MTKARLLKIRSFAKNESGEYANNKKRHGTQLIALEVLEYPRTNKRAHA